MAKQPLVDEDLCIGCGHCAEVCPKVFKVVDEKSQVVAAENCSSCNCQEAIDTCPVQAISWSD